MSKEELAGTNKTPGSLDELLRALEEDHHLLTEGAAFTDDLVRTWINYKLTTRPIRRACARVGTSFLCITATDPALTQVALARGPERLEDFAQRCLQQRRQTQKRTMPGHELHLNLNCLVASWQHPTGQRVGEAAGRAHGP